MRIAPGLGRDCLQAEGGKKLQGALIGEFIPGEMSFLKINAIAWNQDMMIQLRLLPRRSIEVGPSIVLRSIPPASILNHPPYIAMRDVGFRCAFSYALPKESKVNYIA